MRWCGRVLLTLVAMAFLLANVSLVQAAAKKGPALQQLESAAGKKIEDVKVPEPPKPTPVQSSQPTKTTPPAKTKTGK